MKKSFEEALLDLMAEYDDTPNEEIMSALELRLMALQEEIDFDKLSEDMPPINY